MTRLLTTGYETGDVAESGTSTVGTGGALTVVSSTPTPRAGGYCLKVAATSSSVNPTYKTFILAAAKTEVWVRFAFWIHPTYTGNAQIAQMHDSAAGTQMALVYLATDGLLRLYRGTSGGTLVDTASIAFATDAWHTIEWRVQILTGTTGTSEVWLDSTRVINFSGDTSNTATLNVQRVVLGSLSSLTTATGSYMAYDDIAINDTAGSLNNARPGDGRVILLVPSGAGSSTALTRGGTDTGANWSQTSELPTSMTQYVLSATATDRDLYAMSNISAAVASINVVEEVVLAQNSDAGAGSLGLTIKSGSTTNEATAQALGTTAGYLNARWETDPATSLAWTAAAVDALEAGLTVR